MLRHAVRTLLLLALLTVLAAPALAQDPPPLRYLAIGGGSTPEYTEVSLEQDLQLAQQVLPGPGAIFFAGGSDSRSVRVLNPSADVNALLVRIGDMFAPRAGRDSSYRKPKLKASAASLDNVEQALRAARLHGQERQLAGHLSRAIAGTVLPNVGFRCCKDP